MKVKELIKHLRKMNQEAEVVYTGEDGFFQEVCSISTVSDKRKGYLYVGDNEDVVEVV